MSCKCASSSEVTAMRRFGGSECRNCVWHCGFDSSWAISFALSGRFGRLRTDLPIQYLQCFSHHPQIRQREQRRQLRSVPRQAPVTHLHTPELALDHPKRVLDLGAHAGLQSLELIDQLMRPPCLRAGSVPWRTTAR